MGKSKMVWIQDPEAIRLLEAESEKSVSMNVAAENAVRKYIGIEPIRTGRKKASSKRTKMPILLTSNEVIEFVEAQRKQCGISNKFTLERLVRKAYGGSNETANE